MSFFVDVASQVAWLVVTGADILPAFSMESTRSTSAAAIDQLYSSDQDKTNTPLSVLERGHRVRLLLTFLIRTSRAFDSI